MPEEKDRWGDKLHDAEKAREDEYFRKRDQELIEKRRRKEKELEEERRKADSSGGSDKGTR